MKSWHRRLAALRLKDVSIRDVVAFDYPYRQQGRKAPDRQPVLIEAHLSTLRDLAARSPGAPIILIGKSMGGRIGCHVAADHPTEVAAVICLGYPLKSGATGALRDEVLLRLRTPVLFVQGTRDPLCPLATLASTRERMTAPSALHVVDGGNHSLELPAKARAQQEKSDSDILGSIATFLEKALLKWPPS
jgi:predicted alpha/beta-hydrolase family hydrolase